MAGSVRHNNFDFVRLISAFAVLFSHQTALTGHLEPLLYGSGAIKGRSIGAIAVFVFFSISGYLVTLSWQRDPDPLHFARNRLLRIWPGAIVVILLAALVLGPIAGSTPPGEYFSSWGLRQYLRGLAFDLHDQLPGLFTNNPNKAVNGSMWTIPIELTFYAILMVAAAARVMRYPVLVTALAIGCALYATWQFEAIPAERYRVSVEFGAFFLAGVVLRLYEARFAPHRRILVPVAAVVVAVVLLGGLPPYPLLFIAIPLLAIGIGSASTPVLDRAGTYGDFSYGVYLYAFPVQQTVILVTANRLSFVEGLSWSAAITLGCAVLSWKLVEAPALAFKSRRRATIARPAPASTGEHPWSANPSELLGGKRSREQTP